MIKNIWTLIKDNVFLQKQGKYQGAFQYGIFVDNIEVGRMCREYIGGSGPYIERGYSWSIIFWDMPDYGHEDRFDVPEDFPNAKTCREWLNAHISQIRKLQKHSEPNYKPIRERIPDHIR